MPSVSSSIEIKTGPEPIWRLMSEPKRYADYVPATQRLLDTTDETVKVGSTYREYGGIPPFLAESTWVVEEVEPMTHQRHVGDDGKMRIPLELDLEAIDDQTSRLTITVTMEPRWFMVVPSTILWPVMMRKRAQKMVDETVANAKRLAEAGLD